MAIISSFPNNVDEYIGAQEVMHWLHGRTKGVYAGDGNAAVTVAGSMQVEVAPGIGWMTDSEGNGICWWFDSAVTLDIDAAEATGTLDRIDRIIVEWKTTDYADKPEVKVLKGTDSSSASAPALTNNSSLRQISLARVNIPAGTTALSPLNIIDERLDPAVCGVVTESVSADTSMIASQYSDAIQTLYDAIAQAWSGEISDASITMSKLAPDVLDELSKAAITPSAPIAIPASGSSVSRNMEGITADHVLLRWNFVDNGNPLSENLPPCDLTWATYAGYFVISNTSGTTTATVQPVFALPSAIATSNH